MTDVHAAIAPKHSLRERVSQRLHHQPPIAFADLVRLHLRWRKACDEPGGPPSQLEDEYLDALARFQAEHGKIVNAYWCADVESAVALTERRRPVLLTFMRPRYAFHRVSDWATKGQPDIAAQLHRCDELAVRAANVLTGVRRRICMQLAMSAAGHLLSLVDARAAHESEEKTSRALELQKRELEEAFAYLKGAANGQAQIVYFVGIALATAGVSAVAGVSWLWFAGRDRDQLLASLVAGAFGALVSVIQRINTRHFQVGNDDVGKPYLLFLGAVRPIMGAVFGAVVYFALASGLVKIGAVTSGDSNAVIALAFVAGFSERFATDALAVAGLGDPGRRSRARGRAGGAPEDTDVAPAPGEPVRVEALE